MIRHTVFLKIVPNQTQIIFKIVCKLCHLNFVKHVNFV